MLTLSGTVANIYESPKGISKETGEAYGGQHRLQVICEAELKNGSKRVELVDLIVDDVTPYAEALGRPVSVPVGSYVHNGKVAYYAIKQKAAKKA